MSLRDLPPVQDNVEPRDKASQTLLARQAVCPRSAYLHIKHDGGVASHAMHRGSALHAFHERLIRTLVDQGERSLPWEIAKDLVSEVVAENPQWVIPPDEMDVLRLSAYHVADCTVIDPESVLAVEKLFELEIGGMRVRGKVDVAYGVDGKAVIHDLKSQAFVPSQDEIDGKLQLPLYALLVGEGHPVREEVCFECRGTGEIVWFTVSPDATPVRVMPGAPMPSDPDRTRLDADDCEACGGSGRLEFPEAPVGQRFTSFELDEVYPRLEPWLEGTARVLPYRRRSFDRHELVDHRLYIEGLVAKLKHGVDTGEWPAVPGSHCSTCAAPAECPLPLRLRQFHGAIHSHGEAALAAQNLKFIEGEVRDLRRELREFAKAHDVSIPAGRDEEMGFETVESEEWIVGKRIGRPDTASARQAMLDAIDRAVRFGEPFNIDEFRRVRRSSQFRRRKVEQGSGSGAAGGAAESPHPVRAPAEPPDPAELDERWGADAPW